MALNIKSFTTLVQDQAAAIQARAAALLDFSVGSILRALAEANAAIGVWLQSLAIYILSLTRASTSSGVDLDSWMADFGMKRLSAAAAVGQVTFSRYSSGAAGLVPIGSQVQTADRTQTFTVMVDAEHSSYSATLGGYTLAVGVTSVAVPVRANAVGGSGNVVAGTITVIYGSVPGIDYVTNVAAMTGGADAESDAALRARFSTRIAGLSQGVDASVASAIADLQLGVQWSVVQNLTLSGAYKSGFFYVVADDGTGMPSSDLINAVTAAIDRVRPLGIEFAVYSPTVIDAIVSMTVTVDATYNAATVRGQVGAALQQYINTLPLGSGLRYTRLAQIAWDASPGVINVSNVLLNSSTSDIAAAAYNVVKPSSVAVN